MNTMMVGGLLGLLLGLCALVCCDQVEARLPLPICPPKGSPTPTPKNVIKPENNLLLVSHPTLHLLHLHDTYHFLLWNFQVSTLDGRLTALDPDGEEIWNIETYPGAMLKSTLRFVFVKGIVKANGQKFVVIEIVANWTKSRVQCD